MSPSICIFGAGAIGGFIAARLEAAGIKVSIVTRGAHLAAIQRDGLVLQSGGTRVVTRPKAVAHGDVIGPQDYLLLTLKAHSLEAALPQIMPLIGPHTTIVSAVNGVPWWYTYGLAEPFKDRRIQAIDPTGALWSTLPPAQCLGCIVYPAAAVLSPGVVQHTFGERLQLGEPSGELSQRAGMLAACLTAAGLQAPVSPRIRDEMWLKLWGNMAINPISALTFATMDVIIGDPGTAGLAKAMMLEGQAVAETLGTKFPVTVDQRLANASRVGRHKTSMLQDMELNRPLEIEAILGAVVEMAGWAGRPTPICQSILALVKQRAAMRG